MYVPAPSVEAERVWIRQMLPELRLAKALDENRQRVCLARFELYGEPVVLEERGDDADAKLVCRIAVMLREAIGVQTPARVAERSQLEQQVIAAAARGQTDEADRLGRELVMLNATQPRMLNARVAFARRET